MMRKIRTFIGILYPNFRRIGIHRTRTRTQKNRDLRSSFCVQCHMKKTDGSAGFLFVMMIISMSFWGGSWVSAKLISTSLPAELVAFWRFFFHAIAFGAWMLGGRHSFALTRRQLLLLVSAALLLAVYNFLFFYGLIVGFAGKSGVIVTSINPIFSFLIASALFSQKISRSQIIGLAIGVVGGFLLMEPAGMFGSRAFDSTALIFVGAAAVWASLTNISREIRKTLDMVPFSFYLFGLTTLFLALWSAAGGNFILPFGSDPRSAGYDPAFWINVLYLAIPAGVFANSMYFHAVHRLGAHRGASFTFIVPATAMLFSWIFLGEIPRLSTLVGGALALTAVYVINHTGRHRVPEKKSRRKNSRRP
jgi:drug/metabolite transporter (DMT)-like permease